VATRSVGSYYLRQDHVEMELADRRSDVGI
jgi:hypothetical protein